MLSAILPAQAQELQTIYRISGVTDSGAPPDRGVATAFHCSNPRDVSEDVKFIIRNFDGAVVVNRTEAIGPRQTFTATTHSAVVFTVDAVLAPANESIRDRLRSRPPRCWFTVPP